MALPGRDERTKVAVEFVVGKGRPVPAHPSRRQKKMADGCWLRERPGLLRDATRSLTDVVTLTVWCGASAGELTGRSGARVETVVGTRGEAHLRTR